MVSASRRRGGEPGANAGIDWLHSGVPPKPLAWVSTQTSLGTASGPAIILAYPPYRISRFVFGLYAMRGLSFGVGRVPAGASRDQAWEPGWAACAGRPIANAGRTRQIIV